LAPGSNSEHILTTQVSGFGCDLNERLCGARAAQLNWLQAAAPSLYPAKFSERYVCLEIPKLKYYFWNSRQAYLLTDKCILNNPRQVKEIKKFPLHGNIPE